MIAIEDREIIRQCVIHQDNIPNIENINLDRAKKIAINQAKYRAMRDMLLEIPGLMPGSLKLEEISCKERTIHYVNTIGSYKVFDVEFKAKFKERYWNGVRKGNQLVHIRRIDIPTPNDDIIRHEEEMGRKFIERILPEAVYRLGCICCYPDGPDLDIRYNTVNSKYFDIEYWVDFDFKKDEDY